MNLSVEHKKPSIVASLGGGRTANQLCEFASGYSLWKEFGTLNFITKDQYDILIQTFDLPLLDEDSDFSPYYIWREGKFYLSYYKLTFSVHTSLIQIIKI